MGLTTTDVAAVVREIAPALTGGWIQKVFQPAPRAITLDIRVPGQSLSLFISADPHTARLHLLTDRYPNPASPPPFCQFLRAHIQGARIERIEQVQHDRIVRVKLTAREGPCSLIAELTGRHADLLLLDGEDKILAVLDGSREKIGQTYQPPPPRAQSADEREYEEEPPVSDTNHAFPISAAIEQRYRQREAELARQQLRQARLSVVRKRIKKTARRVDALRADLDKGTRYRDYARYGELLKANLPLMKKGQDQVLVVDYFDPALPELTIPLDPAKSPQGNMEDYFKKHRKYLAAEREIRPRLYAAEKELEGLRAELRALEAGTWEPAQSPFPLSRNRPEAVPGEKRSARSAQPRSGPFRRFISADGLPIYVGRNARENELLTFGEARPDDLWLHAHGVPGSHVIARLEKGAEPPPETVRDAAMLALLYSDLKKSGKGEVLYTRKKYVRKAKGKAPGTVTVTQEKTLFVTLDRSRLDRLKEHMDA